MPTPVPDDTICLQCGESRGAVKRKGYFCATVDYYGECQEDWPKHRWADWRDHELAGMGIHPDLWERSRRDNVNTLGFRIAESDCVRNGHRNWADPEFSATRNRCDRCYAVITDGTRELVLAHA